MELIEALACAAAGGVCGMLLMGVLHTAGQRNIAKEYFDLGHQIGEKKGYERGYQKGYKKAYEEVDQGIVRVVEDWKKPWEESDAVES